MTAKVFTAKVPRKASAMALVDIFAIRMTFAIIPIRTGNPISLSFVQIVYDFQIIGNRFSKSDAWIQDNLIFLYTPAANKSSIRARNQSAKEVR